MIFKIYFKFSLLLLLLQLLVFKRARASFELPIATNIGGHAYYTDPLLANGLFVGQWRSSLDPQAKLIMQNNAEQFDPQTLMPQYLKENEELSTHVWGLHFSTSSNRPASWPQVRQHRAGLYTVEYDGSIEFRVENGNCETVERGAGVVKYRCANGLNGLRITAIDASDPPTYMRVMLPDPAAPDSRSLPRTTIWHPTFLRSVRERSPAFGAYRMMDLAHTNANTQVEWIDRNTPHAVSWFNAIAARGSFEPKYADAKDPGAPLEYIVDLCNTLAGDCWINVPALASDDFVRKMAQLFRFGSDGSTPYTSDAAAAAANPVWAAWQHGDNQRRLIVEYSNEIWSSGAAFSQGEWAAQQASALGITKAQFNARRSCQVFAIFREVFGALDDRLVNVAALFTINNDYNSEYAREMSKCTGAAVETIAAVTTYFGNGIQDHVHLARRDVWHAHSLTDDAAYWNGAEFQRDIAEIHQEWRMRVLGESAASGAGPDANGLAGGFPIDVVRLAQDKTLWGGKSVPIVAYEGGPSLYTDRIDQSWRDDAEAKRTAGVTAVCEQLNRDAAMRDVYRAHLTMAFHRGLQQHAAFTDHGHWSKFGQWGHRESIFFVDAARNAPKVAALIDIERDWRCVDRQRVARQALELERAPLRFVTPRDLGAVRYGEPFAADIRLEHDGGPAALANVVVQRVASANIAGLHVLRNCAEKPGVVRIEGASREARYNDGFVMLRAATRDGSDVAMRVFRVVHANQPSALLVAQLGETDAALNTPVTRTSTLNSALVARYTGVRLGALRAFAGAGFVVASGAGQTEITLQEALSGEFYVSLTFQCATSFTRDSVLTLDLQRLTYHADREFAVFVDRFGAPQDAVASSAQRLTSESPALLQFRLQAFECVANQQREIRVYPFAGQYGHKTMYNSISMQLEQTERIDAAESDEIPASVWSEFCGTAQLSERICAEHHSGNGNTPTNHGGQQPQKTPTNTQGSISLPLFLPSTAQRQSMFALSIILIYLVL